MGAVFLVALRDRALDIGIGLRGGDGGLRLPVACISSGIDGQRSGQRQLAAGYGDIAGFISLRGVAHGLVDLDVFFVLDDLGEIEIIHEAGASGQLGDTQIDIEVDPRTSGQGLREDGLAPADGARMGRAAPFSEAHSSWHQMASANAASLGQIDVAIIANLAEQGAFDLIGGGRLCHHRLHADEHGQGIAAWGEEGCGNSMTYTGAARHEVIRKGGFSAVLRAFDTVWAILFRSYAEKQRKLRSKVSTSFIVGVSERWK